MAKVSAIVQGGTHHINGQIPVSYTSHDSEGWHSGTSYESYHATQQSALASRLMPPEKPTKGFHGLVGIGCLPFLFAPCVFVGGAGGLVSPEVPLLGRLVFVLGLGLYVAFLIGLLFLHEHLDKPVQARHTANMRAWEYSLSRWREMYYCSRDDCLFVPGEGLSFNISDFNGAIKWNLGQKSNGFFPKLF